MGRVVITAAGPDWATVMTAVGTVLLAAVTVATVITTVVITKQDRKRADRQFADEQAKHAKEIADERAHSAAQLQEERQRAQIGEQRSEAYAVLVTPGRISAALADPDTKAEAGNAQECPVAVVINNGRFAVTNLEACFAKNAAVYPSRQMEYYSAYPALPQELVSGLVADPAINMLPPAVAGIRFIGGAMAPRDLHGVSPIVRWTDRWGTRWEHNGGNVLQVGNSEE